MSTTETLQQSISLKERLLQQMSKLRLNFADRSIANKFEEIRKFMIWQNGSNSVQAKLEKRQAQSIENGLLLAQQNRISGLVYQLNSFFRDAGKEKARQVSSSPK